MCQKSLSRALPENQYGNDLDPSKVLTPHVTFFKFLGREREGKPFFQKGFPSQKTYMSEIHGNTVGLRETLLAEMQTLYDLELPRDLFVPAELISVLAGYSARINREIALYITRDGEVVDIIIGQLDSVSLPDYRLRRNVKRLSGVRCIHTHPGGCGELSDVDISALRSLRFDAMCAIGVRDGHPREVSAGFLGEM